MKRIVTVACLVAGSLLAETTPVMVSLVTPVQAPSRSYDVTGLRLSLIYGECQDFTGLDIGVIDNTRKDFTAMYDPFHFVQKSMTSGASLLTDAALSDPSGDFSDGLGFEAREYKSHKHMNYWTLGLSFLVNL